MNLLGLLADRGVLDPQKIGALEEESRQTNKPIQDVLVRNGVTAEAILQAEGEYYGLPTKKLADSKIPFEILRYIPEESAAYYRLVPLGVVQKVLEIGIVDPDNLEARDALNFISAKIGLPYKLFVITEEDFGLAIKQYRGMSGEVGRALNELETALVTEDEKKNKKDAFDDEQHVEAIPQSDELDTKSVNGEAAVITEDAPITKIVATILHYAIEGGASDIHVEPMVGLSRVRYRVDGALATSLSLPSKVHQAVVARIKVLSNMRLDEKRKPQDGRFSAHIDNQKVDFRVSTFPTYYGEKVVMRILGLEVKQWKLETMGFLPRDLALLKAALKKPYGMILISGPTGSGKSTTLYAMLNEVDREHQNVLSLEDPVEYNIPGVSQSQVRPEIGYTFATGLRTTLRQDPNVIMVGEIRDKETAQLAVQAALTGHLVLSTIHTNNAVGIIPRLLDMGVDPFLIPPTLILGMAQRLVRTLCPGGGEKVKVEASLEEMLTSEFADLPQEHRGVLPPLTEVFRAKPTPECPNGTRGRAAVFEVMEMTLDMERAILAHGSEEDISGIARKHGMISMKEHAIIKSVAGEVPFEEVNTLGGTFDIADDPIESIPETAAEVPIEQQVTIQKEDAGGTTT